MCFVLTLGWKELCNALCKIGSICLQVLRNKVDTHKGNNNVSWKIIMLVSTQKTTDSLSSMSNCINYMFEIKQHNKCTDCCSWYVLLSSFFAYLKRQQWWDSSTKTKSLKGEGVQVQICSFKLVSDRCNSCNHTLNMMNDEWALHSKIGAVS